ncbi:hypothetical protein UFOVP276_160 [uncultured Caudovirales phage]|uniref:Uncharacterized protein n=1 Tax=uncultured Caudovirales phage TaxID=2100421 RepID=A0A6J5LCW6_9CAUD|nr:hypothetical protein UFOVP127_54 [uncultured Caudovirales phage]CAB4135204.1 hypothetical protein UFOVP276_160 [uncultured Caudovirales phage]
MAEDIKQAKTQEELLRLVDEMAEVLEKEEEIPELRETDLDIEHTRKSAVEATVDIDVGVHQKLFVNCPLGVSRHNQFVYFIDQGTEAEHTNANLVARRGNIVHVDGKKYMIVSVEPRYVDELLKYYILATECMDA